MKIENKFIIQYSTCVQNKLKNRITTLLKKTNDFNTLSLKDYVEDAMNSRIHDVLSSFNYDSELCSIIIK